MNTRQLEYFLELAQTLNYSQASERLGIAQPTMTKAIRHLEQDVGFPLFSRSGKTMQLTAQAEAFLPFARDSLQLLEQGIHLALKEQKLLRVGCISSLQSSLLPELLKCCHRRYPNCYVKIRNGISDKLLDMLERNELDLVLSSPSDRYSDVCFYPLVEQPLMVCLYPGHPLACKAELTPEMLISQTFITHTRNSVFFETYRPVFQDISRPIRVAAEVDEDNALLSLVRSRIGIGIVAMNTSLNTGGVILVPLRQDKVHRMVALGCRQSSVNELKVAELAAQLRPTANS